MKYRIKKSITKKKRSFFYTRARAKRSYRESAEEPIDFSSLFEFSEQYEVLLPVPRKKPSAFSRFIFWLKALFKGLSERLKKIAKKKKERRAKRPETIYMLLGALCSSILVTAISVSIVLVSLFWRYGTPYTTVTVPDLVGTLYEDTEDGASADDSADMPMFSKRQPCTPTFTLRSVMSTPFAPSSAKRQPFMVKSRILAVTIAAWRRRPARRSLFACPAR